MLKKDHKPKRADNSETRQLNAEFKTWKSRFGLFVNGFYADLGHSTKISGVRVEPDLQVFWGATGALYRLGTWDLIQNSQLKFQHSITPVIAECNPNKKQRR